MDERMIRLPCQWLTDKSHSICLEKLLSLFLSYFFQSFISKATELFHRKTFLNRKILLVKDTLRFISNCRTHKCCRPSFWLLSGFKITFLAYVPEKWVVITYFSVSKTGEKCKRGTKDIMEYKGVGYLVAEMTVTLPSFMILRLE